MGKVPEAKSFLAFEHKKSN